VEQKAGDNTSSGGGEALIGGRNPIKDRMIKLSMIEIIIKKSSAKECD